MNSKQLDEVSRNFNELMQLAADLNDLKNELNLHSSLLPHKEIEKEYLQLLSKYENKQNKWRSKAQKLYDKPDFKLDQEDDWNKATAFIYIQSRISLMLNEARYAYTNEKNEYRTLKATIRTRQALVIAILSVSISVFFSFL